MLLPALAPITLRKRLFNSLNVCGPARSDIFGEFYGMCSCPLSPFFFSLDTFALLADYLFVTVVLFSECLPLKFKFLNIYL